MHELLIIQQLEIRQKCLIFLNRIAGAKASELSKEREPKTARRVSVASQFTGGERMGRDRGFRRSGEVEIPAVTGSG